ncbi:hypothetical protein ACIGW3_06845 [Streptomyces sp. NPDC053499]|uniref:hypothetical protein n=1 Tax=Streptomyces sp. NPDC053499 TaxID=3365707 RepID=UPI0037D499B7
MAGRAAREPGAGEPGRHGGSGSAAQPTKRGKSRKALPPVLIGLLLASVGAGLLAAVPVALAKNREYVSAPSCPADRRSDSCRTTVPATVDGTRKESSGRSVHYWLLLTEKGSGHVQRVRMTGSAPVYSAVRAGDEIEVTRWRGEIRTVRFGAAAQETKASPADDWRLPLAFGLLTLPFGLGLLMIGWWLRYRHPTAAFADAWPVTVGMVTATVTSCVGMASAMVTDSVQTACLVTAAGIPPATGLGALCAWGLRRRERRAADTSDIVPLVPAERRCVDATVLGDVPYSVEGFAYLVIGDGRPATTPDPTGRVARRELPETLTVQRLRAVRPDDVDAWYRSYKHDYSYKLDYVVIECLDGEQPVLIIVSRRDAPMTLGALTASPATA